MKMKLFALTSWVRFLSSAVAEYASEMGIPLTPLPWLVIAVFALLPTAAHAQFSANNQTNTISGVASNWVSGSGYIVGNNTFADALIIQSGGALSNGTGPTSAT